MTGDGERRRRRERRRDALREIREELERLRRSEAKIAESLGSLRAARHRVEELVRRVGADESAVRDVVRDDVAAAVERDATPSEATEPRDLAGVSGLFEAGAGERGASPEEGGPDRGEPAGGVGDEPDLAEEDGGHRSLKLVFVTAAGVAVVAVVAWLAVQAFQRAPGTPTLTLSGDTSPAAVEADGAPAAPAERDRNDVERFFVLLPEDVRQQAAVYDSLLNVRSSWFDPLLEGIEAATTDPGVLRALEGWRASTLTPTQERILHSAMVQYALRREVSAELELDGQLLKEPCRGDACSALLNFWETRGEAYGLPPVPEEAPLDTAGLRVAENVLVLRTLEGLHTGAGAPGTTEADGA